MNFKTLALLAFISTNLLATSLDDKILSSDRQKTFNLNEKQINEESNKLKKDWINPITYQLKKNFGEDNKTSLSTISINQPIFQSGGIYEAIKFANSTKEYAKLDLISQKKLLVKSAYSYLYNIKKLDLNMQKTKLQIKNAKIDVERKKEQVLGGLLDSSFLDNALLTLNNTKQSFIDLKYQKKELINNFHAISSKKYTNFSLPKFNIQNKEEFINNNIELKKIKADITKKDNFSYMTKTKYLPSVNIFYNMQKYHDTEGGSANLNTDLSHTYGLSGNVPLDSRAFDDIESKKIDYLKSKLSLKNKITDEENYFRKQLDKISMLEEKKKITKEDLKLYDSILDIIKDEVRAQVKTKSDYETLKNSKDIKSLDLKIYEIEKQTYLLDLYSKMI